MAGKTEAVKQEAPSVMGGQDCPMCHKKTLTLVEAEAEVPYFGKLYIFSMDCSNPECNYHTADVETEEQHEPSRYTLEISEEADMKIRIIKSRQATVKIPHMMTITPGPASNGYITNVEGILNRVKTMIESAKDSEEEDDEAKKKAKNMLKKLLNVTWGREKLTLIIEDPSGNSAIISPKAKVEKLKGK